MTVRRAALAAAMTALVSGCSAVATFPDCYGGTRALFRDPFPITDAQFNLGTPTGTRYAGPMGLIAINTLWLLDLPLSFALDTALSPLTVWTLPHELRVAERKEQAEANRVALGETREARLAAWRADHGLAARALGDSTESYLSERGVHYTLGGDAVEFLSDLGSQAAPWLPQIVGKLEPYRDLELHDPEAPDARRTAGQALEVIAAIGPAAQDEFPAVHALLIRELERGDRVHGIHLELCQALGNMGTVAAPATPQLVQVARGEGIPVGAAAWGKRALRRTIEALREQGGDEGAAGLRVMLETATLPKSLRNRAQHALDAIEGD